MTWTRRWNDVAAAGGVSWDDDPYDSANFENALCVYQKARRKVCRIQANTHRTDTSFRRAPRAVQLDPSKASWSTLAAAALAVEDRGLFEDAVAELEGIALEQPSLLADGLSHEWPLYLAGLTLVRSGRLGEAERIAGQLAGSGYKPATRLRAEIELARNRWGETQSPQR